MKRATVLKRLTKDWLERPGENMKPEVKMMISLHLKPFSRSRSGPNISNGPDTAPTSKSATVRFIIRYVMRFRKCQFLTKTTTVKTLITAIAIHSVSKTFFHAYFSFSKEESLVALPTILQ